MFEAAESGDVEALRAADESALAARKPPYDWTLLHLAAANGHVEAVDVLLERGADVNAREAGDNTYAMHWAAANGHLEVVRRLADAGGDILGAGDDHALEVIGWATCWNPCHTEIAELLVSRGARHHMFSAIAAGLVDEVRAIVAADPAALNRRMSRHEDHRLPLHFAVSRGQPDCVALLIELGADPLGVDVAGHTFAAYATKRDVDTAAMRAIGALAAAELVSARRGERPPRGFAIDLLAALALGDRDAAGQLAGAIRPGVLHQMSKRGDEDAVAWLLERGADPNAPWSHWGADVTALHLAAAYGHEAVVRRLLDAGADPSVRDTVHNSDPAGWAEHFGQPHVLAMLREPEREESVSVVVEFDERDAHLGEILEAFEDGWVVGISSTSGVVRLDLETPGQTWGAAVTIVEGRLERLPFDWRSHVVCRRP